MSLIASITKKSKLNATIKQTALARKSEGHTANGLYKAAFQSFADILQDDPLRAETLYQWGFGLLHQAKTKNTDEAIKIYQDAIEKFAFCLLINPNFLGAAIDGGVAYMDLARLLQVQPDDTLYDLAKKQFEKANAIQAGTASYNLACIYGLRGAQEPCLQALEHARNKVTLPSAEEMLNDPDLDNVKNQIWFNEFIESLGKKTEEEIETEKVEAQEAAQKRDSKWVLVERSPLSEDETAEKVETEVIAENSSTETVDAPEAEQKPEPATETVATAECEQKTATESEGVNIGQSHKGKNTI